MTETTGTAAEKRIIASDGCRLAYRRQGTGPAVVLLHGAGSSTQDNWIATGWWDSLVARDHEVIGIDLRGHGASGPAGAGGMGWRRIAADVMEVVDSLGVDCFSLLGYSAGSGTALRVAAGEPTRVVSVAAGGTGIGGLALAGLEAADGREATSHALARLVELLRSIPALPAAAADLIAAQRREPPGPELGPMPPTLLFVGRDDSAQGRFAAVTCTRWLERQIAGAARLELPGDHVTTLSEPANVRAVTDWLVMTADRPASR